MSRVGKLPISVPSGVTVTLDHDTVKVSGAKGELSQKILPGVTVKQTGGQILVSRPDDQPDNRAKHGLMRTLIYNMIVGVSEGFRTQLEVNGVGYRVALAGSDLRFTVGFSHDVTFQLPPGITASVEQNVVTISGIDKQQVGEVAAQIRALRKPEPYKGKGIQYVGERIIRKSGKSGKE